MPCNDGGPDPRSEALSVLPVRNAMLCALASTLNDQHMLNAVLNSVDWRQAGVTRADFDQWWAEHQRADAVRRQREDAERQRQAKISQARAKLTPDELDALVGRF